MDNNKKAPLFMLSSTFFISLMGMLIKLSGELGVIEKLFFRNIIMVIITFVILVIKKEKIIMQFKNQRFLVLRAITGILGVGTHFYAIDTIGLAHSTILKQLFPFFVVLFAFLFLKEKIKLIQIPIFMIAFIGTVLVINPESKTTIIPSIIAILSAIISGVAFTTVRHLRKAASPTFIVFYYGLFSTIILFPIMITNFTNPNSKQLIYLILAGICGTLGQLSLTKAYRYAPASQVVIYNYLSILFSTFFAFLILSETLTFFNIIGALLIISGGILNYLITNRKGNSPSIEEKNTC